MQEQLTTAMSELPNLPADDVVAGGKEANVVVKVFGEAPKIEQVRDHVTLAGELGLVDFERGVKLGGSGFWIYTGWGARLEWALVNWFIDRLAMERDRGEEPFIGVALLYCALHVAAVPDPSITALCRWTIDREQEEAFGPMGAANDGGWLHRISHHDQRRETWRTVGRRMASLDLSFRSVELREWVALIATSLAEDS